jgi:diaminohydroxyphosphoribosylaminopyrimidine deaminase/5-amino-6-(5-phosphoribosylamino)uracil reductase
LRLFDAPVARVGDPFMRRAAALAESVRGLTAPNPWVGCVIVSPDGRIVGEGFHERAGELHAEARAIAAAGADARGATAYVTLEPCAHQGRTPPCADALAQAGVADVVIGVTDPHPLARGGADKLRALGVNVRRCDPADEALLSELLEEWLFSVTAGRPFVTVKLGLSLDAKPSTITGARSEITGPDGQLVSMWLRRGADTVLVGATTVGADDPSLTRREPDGTPAARQPLRVVLAGETLPDPGATVFTDGLGPAALLVPHTTSGAALEPYADEGVDVALYGAERGIPSALEALAGLGAVHVLAETGPRTFTSIWDSGAMDALVIVTAGGIAGVQAPGIYRGEDEHPTAELHRAMSALEAGVVGEVAAVQWRTRKVEDTGGA